MQVKLPCLMLISCVALSACSSDNGKDAAQAARSVEDLYAEARDFAARAGAVIGYGVCCRRCPAVSVGGVTYTSPWSCSVPCAVPGAELSLGAASRGSRAVIRA